MKVSKTYRDIIDDPWAGFIALGVIIFIGSIIGIVLICIFYLRYVRKRAELISLNQLKLPEMDLDPELREYETQSLNMYVPAEEFTDLGEVQIDFTPDEGIYSVTHLRNSSRSGRSGRSTNDGVCAALNPIYDHASDHPSRLTTFKVDVVDNEGESSSQAEMMRGRSARRSAK